MWWEYETFYHNELLRKIKLTQNMHKKSGEKTAKKDVQCLCAMSANSITYISCSVWNPNLMTLWTCHFKCLMVAFKCLWVLLFLILQHLESLHVRPEYISSLDTEFVKFFTSPHNCQHCSQRHHLCSLIANFFHPPFCFQYLLKTHPFLTPHLPLHPVNERHNASTFPHYLIYISHKYIPQHCPETTYILTPKNPNVKFNK